MKLESRRGERPLKGVEKMGTVVDGVERGTGKDEATKGQPERLMRKGPGKRVEEGGVGRMKPSIWPGGTQTRRKVA